MTADRQKILNVAVNESLLKSRSAILEGAGYDVVPALNILEVERACETHRSFDLVIIGQSLPKPEKKRVMGTVRRSCGAVPILELYPHGATPADEEADDMAPTPGDADTLLAKVHEV